MPDNGQPPPQMESTSALAPREFEITPSSGVLAPQSQLEVRVDLCLNTVRKYNTELHVDVDAIQQGLLLLPITARHEF